jgi:NADH-quinone oxidoreductase subunit H
MSLLGAVLNAAGELDWFALGIKLAVVAAVVPGTALVSGYAFLKVLAHMQSRLGPMEAGRYHGWAQLLADGLKFIQKEDVIPEAADRRVFAFAPAVSLMAVFLVFIFVPISPTLEAIDLDVGVFALLAVTSLSTIGVLMAGWSSANKYSLMGGFRAAGQLIAYELPLVLAVVGVVMQAGTLSLQGIVQAQADYTFFGTDLAVPFLFPQIVGFVIFLIAAQAELSQAPFDMPFAESELVAGFATEYTGFRYLFFFVAEFASNVALAAVGATLFLGGWYVPFLSEDVLRFLGPFVLLAKTALLVFVFFWMRSTYPRLREDQLQRFAWKYLIPVSLVNIGITGVAKVVL